MSGTPSIREESAPCASTSGQIRNAYRAPSGRRIQIGTLSEPQIATITRPGFDGRSTNS